MSRVPVVAFRNRIAVAVPHRHGDRPRVVDQRRDRAARGPHVAVVVDGLGRVHEHVDGARGRLAVHVRHRVREAVGPREPVVGRVGEGAAPVEADRPVAAARVGHGDRFAVRVSEAHAHRGRLAGGGGDRTVGRGDGFVVVLGRHADGHGDRQRVAVAVVHGDGDEVVAEIGGVGRVGEGVVAVERRRPVPGLGREGHVVAVRIAEGALGIAGLAHGGCDRRGVAPEAVVGRGVALAGRAEQARRRPGTRRQDRQRGGHGSLLKGFQGQARAPDAW